MTGRGVGRGRGGPPAPGQLPRGIGPEVSIFFKLTDFSLFSLSFRLDF